MRKVLGVLAGRDLPSGRLLRWAQWADEVLAADAGADRLHEVGIEPNIVIGDFDSFSGAESSSRLVQDGSQDTTDCDKLLALTAELGHTHITLASVEGDQLDHMIATLHSAAKQDVAVRIALRTGLGWVLRGPTACAIEAPEGRRVSLLPLAECHNVSIRGVEWPLESAELHPLRSTSIGNRSNGGPVEVAVEDGIVFFFLETSESDPMEDWALEQRMPNGPSA